MTTFYRSGNLLCLEGGVCICMCACSAGGSMGADARVKKKMSEAETRVRAGHFSRAMRNKMAEMKNEEI